jgi:hypothetical protein
MKIVAAVVLLFAVAILTSCGGGDSGGTTTSGTLAYYSAGQNGMLRSPWGDGSSSDQPAVAVEFTPASYPITIRSVTVFAKNNTGVDQPFNLYGYTDLTSASNLFNPVLNQTIPDTGSSYVAKTVDIPPTPITSGSFYIAVEWVTKPLSSLGGTNSFFMLTDSNPDYMDRNFVRAGSTWYSYASMRNTGGSGDLGIVVNY